MLDLEKIQSKRGNEKMRQWKKIQLGSQLGESAVDQD